MKIPRERKIFKDRRPVFSALGVFLLMLILLNLVALNNKEMIQRAILPTPLPTRTSNSYLLEGQAFFMAGNLDAAIEAYKEAVAIDPENVEILSELARVQVYSSKILTPQDSHTRLTEARETIEQAVSLDDRNSLVQAIRALVYDWSAFDSTISLEEYEEYLSEASQSAELAMQLDNRSALAIAFRAEVMADQQRFTQALQWAELAVTLEPKSLDTHRVYAYVLESTGNYSKAIEEYKLAAEIMPNLTFLYISIGQNYRQLQLYDHALEYFDRAATINENLNIKDPLPYLAIAKTYTRQGQFFAAARNADVALSYDPRNPDLYGQLGFIRFQARNYEGSIPMLECAVDGCEVLFDEDWGVIPFIDATDDQLATLPRLTVVGLPLSNSSVVYYYVYGSVLAAFNQCDKALEILGQVRANFSGDALIMGIVQESEYICELFQANE
jgi:tetratricopeptide (TPR) repeat protein